MDERLMTLAIARGFLTRPEILDSGYDDRDIRAAIRAGVLHRIGPGLYAEGIGYSAMSPEQRHVVRCRAVAHRHRGSVAVTHQSAAAIHGAALWGVDLTQVNVTRLDGRGGRHEAGVNHHIGRIDDSELIEVDGMLVATPARAIWETACIASTEAGLVTVDSALHLGLVSDEELHNIAAGFDNWQGSRSARLTLSLARGEAESPGESRSRFLFWRHDLPSPELQFRVTDGGRRVLARTDFAWLAYRHLGEFDGKVKYRVTPGTDPTETIVNEKVREDLARGALFGMSRLVWRDLDPRNAATTVNRIERGLEQSRRLYTRNRQIIA